jgi:hypothetical protein
MKHWEEHCYIWESAHLQIINRQWSIWFSISPLYNCTHFHRGRHTHFPVYTGILLRWVWDRFYFHKVFYNYLSKFGYKYQNKVRSSRRGIVNFSAGSMEKSNLHRLGHPVKGAHHLPPMSLAHRPNRKCLGRVHSPPSVLWKGISS